MKRAVVAILILVATLIAVALAVPERVRPVLPAPLVDLLPVSEPDDAPPDQGARAIPVHLAGVVQATAVARFETSGAVQAADQVVLRSEMAGRVNEVPVEDGAALERGDPILRFEQDAEQAAVEAAQIGRASCRERVCLYV